MRLILALGVLIVVAGLATAIGRGVSTAADSDYPNLTPPVIRLRNDLDGPDRISPFVGQTYALWSVTNEGAGFVEDFDVSVTFDGEVIATLTCGGLDTSGSCASTVDLGEVEAGPHTVEILADSTDAIFEHDEFDNTAERTATWNEPTGTPTSTRLSTRTRTPTLTETPDWSATPPQSPSPSGTPTKTPITVDVAVLGLAFDPEDVAIAPEDTVLWTVQTGSHRIRQVDDLFDSGVLNQGQTFSVKQTTVGVYEYECTIHPDSMRGWIAVSDDRTVDPPTRTRTRTATRTRTPARSATATRTRSPTRTATLSPTPHRLLLPLAARHRTATK